MKVAKQQKEKEKQIFTQNHIVYSIQEGEKKVSVVGYEKNSPSIDLIIPRSVNYNSTEYIVTSISVNAFSESRRIKSISFPEDSELTTIERNVFVHSSIQSISIPTSLIDLQKGWSSISNINKIKVSSKNERYSIYEDKYIIGKSSLEQENYDILVFSIRNIEAAIIPDFIEIIGPYSFENCEKLQTIEFSNNSKIRVIDESSFEFSKLKKISIPSSVTKIGQLAFGFCGRLSEIIIPKDSKINQIDDYAFSYSGIEEISIPSQVTKISKKVFSNCTKLHHVNFPLNSKIESFEEESFNDSGIDEITR